MTDKKKIIGIITVISKLKDHRSNFQFHRCMCYTLVIIIIIVSMLKK